MKVIRREIVIDAPLAKVWEHITDPEKIAGWLMPNDFAPTVGKKFTLDCQQQGAVSCQDGDHSSTKGGLHLPVEGHPGGDGAAVDAAGGS